MDEPWATVEDPHLRSMFRKLPEGYEEEWERFSDPAQTLEDLTDAAIAQSGAQDNFGRIRSYVLADPKPLLDGSFAEQQWFLQGLQSFRSQHERAMAYPWVRWVGLAMLVAALGGGVLGFLLAPYRVTGILGLPTIWRILITIAVSGLIGLFAWLGYDAYLDDWAMYVSMVVAILIAAAGYALATLDVVANRTQAILIALGIIALLAALGITGERLRRRYWPDSRYSVQATYDAWRSSLLSAGVLPALKAALNQVTVEEYSLFLSVSDSISPNETRAVIETSAANALREHTAWRTKGSFALAGPRGSGKSTLLHRWASGAYASRDASDKVARRDLIVEVSAPVGYDHKEFLVYLFGRLCEAVERYAERYDDSGDTAKTGGLPGSRRRGAGHDPGGRRRRDLTTLTDLVTCARAERDAIRYVQSTTSARELNAGFAHSGLTVGAKGTNTVRRDDIPLNYPELVDEFRWFLEQSALVVTTASRTPRRPWSSRSTSEGPADSTSAASVLIAIDELDRISDGELAQKFINEMKAVFGVPNCFFLVSVSEDALAEFELAAMGMRTVFDSAFDEIIRVDYLGVREAREILERLIVGLPQPFIALAYVLSGGLARQLVRIAFQMAKMGRSTAAGCSIDEVSAGLVDLQLSKTVRAAVDRLFGSVSQGAGGELFRILDDMPAGPHDSRAIRHLEEQLRGLVSETHDTPLVAKLRDEVAAMANYLATVLDVFNHQLSEASYERRLRPGPDGFDTLARARRYLGANPRGADELLAAFRGSSTQRTRSDGRVIATSRQ